jgi:hypothetical protein
MFGLLIRSLQLPLPELELLLDEELLELDEELELLLDDEELELLEDELLELDEPPQLAAPGLLPVSVM